MTIRKDSDYAQALLAIKQFLREAEDHARAKRWEQAQTALRSVGYWARDASLLLYEEEQRLARLERLT